MIKIEFKIGKTEYQLWNDTKGNHMFGKFLCTNEKTGDKTFAVEGGNYYATLGNAVSAILQHKINRETCKTFKKLVQVQQESLEWIKDTFGQFDIKVTARRRK